LQRATRALTHRTARERDVDRNPIADGKKTEGEQTAHQWLCVAAKMLVDTALVLVPEEDARAAVSTREDRAIALFRYDRHISKITGQIKSLQPFRLTRSEHDLPTPATVAAAGTLERELFRVNEARLDQGSSRMCTQASHSAHSS